MDLKPLGKIVQLQIQRTTLSLGQRPNRYYDPAGLVAVPELTLTPRGALARLPNHDVALDYHHSDYPEGGNHEGENDLSINFTSHYEAIRNKYGASEHLYNGCGGENILIEVNDRVGWEAVSGGVAVRTQAGGLAWLRSVVVAHPCQPFSKYVSRATEPENVKEALQFLDGGTRGFYCTYEGEPVTVRLGDEVLAPLQAIR